MIFQSIKTNNYIVLLRYGNPKNFYNIDEKNKINACIKLIKQYINENENNNIFLFGMSMGGTMAQHISIQLKDLYNVYFVSLGIGNTINENDLNIIENNFKGKYISLGLGYMDGDNLIIDEFLKGILLNVHLKTLPTMFLVSNNYSDINNGLISEVMFIESEISKTNFIGNRNIHKFKLFYEIIYKFYLKNQNNNIKNIKNKTIINNKKKTKKGFFTPLHI
jgi:hypothetical protein